MKSLGAKASRRLGYGSLLLAITILFLKGLESDEPNWIPLMFALFAVIGTTQIYRARDADFDRLEPWLFRIIFIGRRMMTDVAIREERSHSFILEHQSVSSIEYSSR